MKIILGAYVAFLLVGSACVIVGIVLFSDTVASPLRRRGLCANPLLLLDEGMKTTGLTDPIGGSASFYDTRVKVVRV